MHKKSRRVNKRQRRRSRKHGGKMRLKMKGGLGIHNLQQIESPYLNMQQMYSFRFPNEPRFHFNMFKQYVFGSEAQRVAWESLLTNCQRMGVLVYVLSAGNKIGIIRMLQLMGLDNFFEEVLCTNNYKNEHDEFVHNPLTQDGTHNFQGQTKYNVIRTILRERFPSSGPDPLVAAGPPIGYLMDDDARNDDTTVQNKSIPFVNVNSVEQTPTQTGNMFYNFVATYPVSLQPLINSRAFADVNVINQVALLVQQGLIRILFIDFDKTFQQYAGALPFHDDRFTTAFHGSFPIAARFIW